MFDPDDVAGNNIIDPAGRFDTIEVNSSTVSANTATGALTVAGGVGFASNLNLGTNLNLGGDVTATGNIISPRIYHDSILTVEGETSIAIKIADTSVGTVLSTGLSIPINKLNHIPHLIYFLFKIFFCLFFCLLFIFSYKNFFIF